MAGKRNYITPKRNPYLPKLFFTIPFRDTPIIVSVRLMYFSLSYISGTRNIIASVQVSQPRPKSIVEPNCGILIESVDVPFYSSLALRGLNTPKKVDL